MFVQISESQVGRAVRTRRRAGGPVPVIEPAESRRSGPRLVSEDEALSYWPSPKGPFPDDADS